ncbi:histidine phosphatase family protein, partial [Streptomyces sp. SID11233]|nr:histidine phosphatase family protein [Streptomyces sp. SID11233]
MGEVILVRHGETAWSLTGKHTSYTELPLTARGEEQAKSLAPLLARRKIALTVTSPMQRAVRTAR